MAHDAATGDDLASRGIAFKRHHLGDGELGAGWLFRNGDLDEGHRLFNQPAFFQLGFQIEGRPLALAAVSQPPMGLVADYGVIGGEIHQRFGGCLGLDEGNGIHRELALVRGEIPRSGAGFQGRHGGFRHEPPGEAGEGVRPFFRLAGLNFPTHGFPQFFGVMTGTEAEGFQIRAVLAVVAGGDVHEDFARLLEVAVAHGQRRLGADFRRGVGGKLESIGHGVDFPIGAADRAEGGEAVCGVGSGDEGIELGAAFFTEVGQQPDGAGGDEGIGIFENFGDGSVSGGAGGFQFLVTERADIHRRGFQGERGSVERVEVDFRHGGFEALRRDPVDDAGSGVILGVVATDARVGPVGDVERAIRADADVGGTEVEPGLVRISHAAVLFRAAGEVGSVELFFRIGRQEIGALQLESRAVLSRLVAENDISRCLAGQQRAGEFPAQRAVFVKRDPRRRAAAVNVASGHGFGVFLPPMRGRRVLARTLVRIPGPFPIRREIPGVSVLQHVAGAAGRRVVIVVLEDEAAGADRLFVGIPVAVTDDFRAGGVRVHAHSEAADIDESVAAGFAGSRLGIERPLTAAAFVVGAADREFLAGFVREDPAGVALVEIPFPVRAGGEGMQRVVVVFPVESGEQDFPRVACGRFELPVAVHIGELEQIRRLGHDDHVVKNGDAERRDQLGILPEDLGTVTFPVAVRVFKNHDPVACRLAVSLFAVGDALRHPDAAEVVDVDVRGIEKRGRGGPRGDFQSIRQDEGAERHGGRFLTWRPGVGGGNSREDEEIAEDSHKRNAITGPRSVGYQHFQSPL